MENDELKALILKLALKNAVKFKGKANLGAVMGKIMAENKELRSKAKEIKKFTQEIINEVNSMPLDVQTEKLLSIDPNALQEEKSGPEEKVLPDLPNAEEGKVVMRLAPYPSGALHIGNARMIILNDEYVKRYKGKLLLVFDDTIGTTKEKMNDPNAKYVIPEAYDLIKEGLEWLGVKYHAEYYKSDRVEIYQNEAGKLIEQGKAYVCTCDPKEFREKYKIPGKPCPCRSKSIEYHIEMYEKMKGGQIAEGAAVVRLKTGMDQKDPAMRDHIIMRISDAPHPRIGTKYRLWPILEWSWGLDDHLLGITHIIRGIDLRKEGEVEKFIWDLYGWKHPEIILYGRLKFEDIKLSKTKARQKIASGEYDGWNDPRTWSLQSLRDRGIQPQAVREALVELGLSKRGIIFDKEWVYAKNRAIIDPIANRFWYAERPRRTEIHGIKYDKDVFIAQPLVNPNDESKGVRSIEIPIKNGSTTVFISEIDLEDAFNEKGQKIREKLKEGDIVRLKDMFNITIEKIDNPITATFHSLKKIDGVKIIQCVPEYKSINVRVLQPDGIIKRGVGESNLRKLHEGDIIQFIRYGFVRVKQISDDEIYCYYAHS